MLLLLVNPLEPLAVTTPTGSASSHQTPPRQPRMMMILMILHCAGLKKKEQIFFMPSCLPHLRKDAPTHRNLCCDCGARMNDNRYGALSVVRFSLIALRECAFFMRFLVQYSIRCSMPLSTVPVPGVLGERGYHGLAGGEASGRQDFR